MQRLDWWQSHPLDVLRSHRQRSLAQVIYSALARIESNSARSVMPTQPLRRPGEGTRSGLADLPGVLDSTDGAEKLAAELFMMEVRTPKPERSHRHGSPQSQRSS